MSELDLTEAIEVAAKAMWDVTVTGELWEAADDVDSAACRSVARSVLTAAAPLIERAIREQVAEEIKEFAKEAAKTDSPDAILGLLTGSVIASGQRKASFDELADDLDELLGRESEVPS